MCGEPLGSYPPAWEMKMGALASVGGRWQTSQEALDSVGAPGPQSLRPSAGVYVLASWLPLGAVPRCGVMRSSAGGWGQPLMGCGVVAFPGPLAEGAMLPFPVTAGLGFAAPSKQACRVQRGCVQSKLIKTNGRGGRVVGREREGGREEGNPSVWW